MRPTGKGASATHTTYHARCLLCPWVYEQRPTTPGKTGRDQKRSRNRTSAARKHAASFTHRVFVWDARLLDGTIGTKEAR